LTRQCIYEGGQSFYFDNVKVGDVAA